MVHKDAMKDVLKKFAEVRYHAKRRKEREEQ